MVSTDDDEESFSEEEGDQQNVSDNLIANCSNDNNGGGDDDKITSVLESDKEDLTQCLACGSTTSLVKIKTEEEDKEDEQVRDQDNWDMSASKDWKEQVPEAPGPNEEDGGLERKIFVSFCKLLGVKLTGIRLEKTKKNEKDDGVPSFCQICRNQLGLLLDLQDKLKELERDLDSGIREFKTMCQRAENKFQESQVYEKDKTYLKIRRQICGKAFKEFQVVKKAEDRHTEPTRKSTRNSSHVASPPEQEVVIKTEPGVAALEDIDNDIDLEDLLDSPSPYQEDEDDIPSSEDYDYEPPPSPPKKRKKVGRPPTKKKKSTAAKKPVRKSDATRTPSKKAAKPDTDYVPWDDEECESDEDVEASLKGRMTTDPTTGHVIFLNVSFEPLDTGRYRCLTCEKDSAYHRGSLKKHVITMHTDMFVCQECGQHCPSSKSLTSHVRRVHRGEDRKTVECPVCGKPCSSKRGRMEKHMGTHLSAQEKQEAKERGEEIPQWSKLRRHVCEECGRGYELRAHLIQHKIREHPSTDYTEDDKMACKEMCPDCGKLVHRHYLKKHQEFVHSEGVVKRFSCMLCEKRFVKEGDLRKHKSVVHEKIRPYQCTLCPKQFALKTQLNYHLHTHQNIRPFQCDHCPMAFARKHHLERHLRIYHEPGANPKRKTYVKGPETKSKGEEGAGSGGGRTQGGGGPKIESSQMTTGAPSRANVMAPLALDTQHHHHQQQQMTWMDHAPTGS